VRIGGRSRGQRPPEGRRGRGREGKRLKRRRVGTVDGLCLLGWGGWQMEGGGGGGGVTTVLERV
jgi:hypothetical protein